MVGYVGWFGWFLWFDLFVGLLVGRFSGVLAGVWDQGAVLVFIWLSLTDQGIDWFAVLILLLLDWLFYWLVSRVVDLLMGVDWLIDDEVSCSRIR